MTSLKNVVEDIVVEEVKSQIEGVNNNVALEIQLNEVAAYALNRLPPMYASTDRGWLQQRKRAHSELSQQIGAAVRQAMMNVRRDPLRQAEPLPEDELASPAYTLLKLQQLLGKSDLHWADLPVVVEEVLDNFRYGGRLHNIYNYAQRKDIKELKDYLKRSKVAANNLNHDKKVSLRSWLKTDKSSLEVLEEQEFASYMLTTSCVLTNVMEKLVVNVAELQIQRLKTVFSRKVQLEDVAAYALNRLPPLYATSAQGVARQNERVKAELANEIESKVLEAILTLSKAPKRLTSPLPIAKFDDEQEKALAELRLMLRRDDVTWRNVCALLEEALERAAYEGSNWRERWQIIGQIYKALELQPGDADLSIPQATSGQGESLYINVYSKEAFINLVDNPPRLARHVLKFLPDVEMIEIISSWAPFPLTYTRDEMAEDGITV